MHKGKDNVWCETHISALSRCDSRHYSPTGYRLIELLSHNSLRYDTANTHIWNASGNQCELSIFNRHPRCPLKEQSTHEWRTLSSFTVSNDFTDVKWCHVNRILIIVKSEINNNNTFVFFLKVMFKKKKKSCFFYVRHPLLTNFPALFRIYMQNNGVTAWQLCDSEVKLNVSGVFCINHANFFVIIVFSSFFCLILLIFPSVRSTGNESVCVLHFCSHFIQFWLWEVK